MFDYGVYTMTWQRLFFVFVLTSTVLATPVRFWWSGDQTQDGMMTMYNPSAEDGDTGIPVYSADIDGDGRMDAIISAITGDGRNNDRSSCGELHVLFGVDTIRGQVDFQYYDGVYPNLFTIWAAPREIIWVRSTARRTWIMTERKTL